MEVDPATLDPEERMNKFYALASAALGLLSLCGAILPICGGPMAIVGIVLGALGRKSESKTMATVGMTAIVYAVFVYIVRS
jgi:predicted branched-subunit amino acid permease